MRGSLFVFATATFASLLSLQLCVKIKCQFHAKRHKDAKAQRKRTRISIQQQYTAACGAVGI
jgi:hypothetical protein